MKRKIIFTIAMALTTTFLASCSACDSCAGNTKVSFKDYYVYDADIDYNNVDETLTYKVTHSGNATYNGYTVQYSNGQYKTHLQKTGEDLYTLTSDFSINVCFVYGGVSTEVLTDTTHSVVVFHSAKNMLKPVSSEKTLYSHSPARGSVTELNDCYEEYHQTVKTVYNENGGEFTITDHMDNDATSSKSFEIENTEKYAYLDNEQLLFALRCMSPSSTAKVQVCDPFDNSMQLVSTTFGSSTATDFKNLVINGETKESLEISYYPVSWEKNAKNNGTTKTVWIAETKDANNNTYRNVMLKYIVPLPFTLGELTYELVSANFSN